MTNTGSQYPQWCSHALDDGLVRSGGCGNRVQPVMRAITDLRDWQPIFCQADGVMQEVLSKPEDSSKPLHEQVFHALRLFDRLESWRPGYMVEESRIAWSEVDGRFMCTEIETERLPTSEEARKRYHSRRDALINKGFILSDMDF